MQIWVTTWKDLILWNKYKIIIIFCWQIIDVSTSIFTGINNFFNFVNKYNIPSQQNSVRDNIKSSGKPNYQMSLVVRLKM